PVVRHKFEVPAGDLGVKGKNGIDIYAGPKLEWIGYVSCKAAWANEARFREKHGTGTGWTLEEERACVLNELMTRYNRAENALVEAQKKKGVADPSIPEADILPAMDPLGRHLFQVAEAKLLDGYILFEVIGQHCPVAMSILDDQLLKELDTYIRTYVIAAAP
ncbi:MAG: hypothetical protein JWN02_13, partial [Acidobacteria bacterium]|nr:hypothetical protein [Acidobacteriota bacterium]